MSDHRFLLREARLEDTSSIWDLVLELAEFERLSHTVTGTVEAFREGLGKDFECWLAEFEGQIVGYGLTFSTYSTFRARRGMWLEDLYVTPAMRGKGCGKAILEFLIEEARSRGCGRLEWSVLDWNVDAVGFYERMGAVVLPDWRTCRVDFE